MDETNMLDLLWEDMVRREDLVDPNALERALEALNELQQHKIQKPLYGLLIDKKLLSKEKVKETGDRIAAFCFRCPHCRERLPLRKISRENTVKCSRCSARIKLSYERNEESVEKGIRAALLEKPSAEKLYTKEETTSTFKKYKAEFKRPPAHDAPSSSRGKNTFSRKRPAPSRKTTSRRKNARLSFLHSISLPHPLYFVGFSAVVLIVGLVFFFSRYSTWAKETRSFTSADLLHLSAAKAIDALREQKEFLSGREAAEKAYHISAAYEGTNVEAQINALMKDLPDQRTAPWDQHLQLQSALTSGRLLTALGLFYSNSCTPQNNAKTWSVLQGLAADRGLVLHHRAKIDLPGIQTFFHPPFLIDRKPVTTRACRRFLESMGGAAVMLANKTAFATADPEQQVTGISYTMAEQIAKWQGKRLPTEFELRLAGELATDEFEWVAPHKRREKDAFPLAVQVEDNRIKYRRFSPDEEPAGVTFRFVQELD